MNTRIFKLVMDGLSLIKWPCWHHWHYVCDVQIPIRRWPWSCAWQTEVEGVEDKCCKCGKYRTRKVGLLF